MTKREAFANALTHTGLAAVIRRCGGWNGLLVLNYHRIGDARSQYWDPDLFSATQEAFSHQVRFLKSNFDVVGVDDLASIQGKKGRFVQITFDDGYRDNHDLAFPVLQSEGATATFFVCTGFIDFGNVPWWDELAWMINHSKVARLNSFMGIDELVLRGDSKKGATRRLNDLYDHLSDVDRGDFLNELAEALEVDRCPSTEAKSLWMDWDMIASMHQGGMTIGGHTLNHIELSRHTEDQQLDEILGSCRRITERIGAPVKAFSFPYGAPYSFNEDTRKALKRAGIEYGYSYYGGYQKPDRWDCYNLLRIAVEDYHSEALFKATLTLPSLLA